jgi:hypothetical protein
MSGKFFGSTDGSSENFEHALEVIELIIAWVFIHLINQLHTEVWTAQSGQTLNMTSSS